MSLNQVRTLRPTAHEYRRTCILSQRHDEGDGRLVRRFFIALLFGVGGKGGRIKGGKPEGEVAVQPKWAEGWRLFYHYHVPLSEELLRLLWWGVFAQFDLRKFSYAQIDLTNNGRDRVVLRYRDLDDLGARIIRPADSAARQATWGWLPLQRFEFRITLKVPPIHLPFFRGFVAALDYKLKFRERIYG